MTDEPQLLTHSRMRCARDCFRKHEFRYELGIVPDTDPESIRVGTAFHKAKEAADLGQDPEKAIEGLGILDPYELGLVCAMHVAHEAHWAGSIGEVIATELPFNLPLRNPDTGAATPIWRWAGKIDRIYKLHDGRLALCDFKTTSEDIEPDSDYWLRMRLDQQMSGYVLAARELGYDIQTILYDVTKRPMQRPYKATPPEKRQYTKAGALYASQRERDETPHEYAARVVAAMQADPAKFHVRHEIARLDSDLEEWQAEVWTQQLMIREMQRTGRWFRNTNACIRVGQSPCSYLPICDSKLTKDSPVPAGYKRIEFVHPELEPKETR